MVNSAIAVLLILIASAPAWAQAKPIINETAKLLAPDGEKDDRFGASVAISGDTAIVGMLPFYEDDESSGSVHIFVRGANGKWSQQAKLRPDDGERSAVFGAPVAISGDTAIVGDPINEENGQFSGSVYVFTRDANDSWTQQAKLLADDGTRGDQFGTAVAISGDTIVVGAPSDYAKGVFSGSAYVFTRNFNGVWTQQAKLLSNIVTKHRSFSGWFGSSVAISDNTIVIGKPGDPADAVPSSAAFVFEADADGVWTLQTKLLPDAGVVNYLFGISVDISGNTAIVGAIMRPHFSDAGEIYFEDDPGAAFIFVRGSDGVWAQEAKLLSEDGMVPNGFGVSVALSGNRAVVGTPGDIFYSGIFTKMAYLFVRGSGGVWTKQSMLLASDGEMYDLFGSTVAINGDTVVIGASNDEDNGKASGSAYIFELHASDLNYDGVVDHADLAALLTQWGSSCPEDFNGDGVVNSADLAFLLANWTP